MHGVNAAQAYSACQECRTQGAINIPSMAGLEQADCEYITSNAMTYVAAIKVSNATRQTASRPQLHKNTFAISSGQGAWRHGQHTQLPTCACSAQNNRSICLSV
jgi:hypothetical protein